MKRRIAELILVFILAGMLLTNFKMPLGNAASQVDINNAITRGLAYLNSTQASDGHWGDGWAPQACTAMAVLAFENAPNNHFGWNMTDPYHTTVQKGLDWLFAHAYVQYSITSKTLANGTVVNPDSNGNGIGIYISDGSYPIYETPMMLMAIVASQAPTNITTTGPTNVVGRTYHDIVVDIVDYLAWAQNEIGTGRGGWRYQPQSGDSDNSNSQWPVLGLMAAELWGIKAPSWVKSELLNYWVPYSEDLRGNYASNYYYGAFGYGSNDWGPYGLETIAETSAGIMELTYCGVDKTDARILAAEGFISRDWGTTGSGPYGWDLNIGNLYSMYAVMKACRLTTPTPIKFIENYTGSPTIEWYNGTGQYADWLIGNGIPSGVTEHWVNTRYVEDVYPDLSTAWGVLILEYVPVKVTYKFTVTVVDALSSSPIAGASVLAEGPETRSGTTDSSGNIVFSKIQAGNYLVNASAANYMPSTPEMISVTSDTSFTIKLQPIPRGVIPEVPIGTIAALISMMMAMLGYIFVQRLKRKAQ